jgi:uncharacterized membrane protein HdeD (DUF308 family)
MSAHSLAQSWWLIVLRGAVSVLLGLAAVVWPGLALSVAVSLLGVYLLADGLLAATSGLSRKEGSQVWWLLLAEGAIGITAGIGVLVWPGLSAAGQLYIVAAWATLTGMIAMIAAIRLRADITHEGLLAISGLLSVALGMVLFIWPGASAITALWLIGTYAILSGLLLIGLGLRLWHWQTASQRVLQPVGAGPGRHSRRSRRD